MIYLRRYGFALAPFTGLSAERFRPAVHGGLDVPHHDPAPFTGLLALRL